MIVKNKHLKALIDSIYFWAQKSLLFSAALGFPNRRWARSMEPARMQFIEDTWQQPHLQVQPFDKLRHFDGETWKIQNVLCALSKRGYVITKKKIIKVNLLC